MNAIRVRKTLESDTLHLPELKPLVGRTVEIIVLDEGPAVRADQVRPGTGDWAALEEIARELQQGGYDFDAWRRQREFDRKHAEDHLP